MTEAQSGKYAMYNVFITFQTQNKTHNIQKQDLF